MENEALLIPAIFVNTLASYRRETLREVVVNKLDRDHSHVLHQVNPAIERISVIDQIVYADIGLGKMMPLNTFGSGLAQVANVYSTALSGKSQIILIDEIENGLHHTAMTSFLEALITLTYEQNLQIFATSHSLDVLQQLQGLLLEDRLSDARSEMRCYVLAKNKDGKVIAYRYDHQKFNHCIQHGIEIR